MWLAWLAPCLEFVLFTRPYTVCLSLFQVCFLLDSGWCFYNFKLLLPFGIWIRFWRHHVPRGLWPLKCIQYGMCQSMRVRFHWFVALCLAAVSNYLRNPSHDILKASLIRFLSGRTDGRSPPCFFVDRPSLTCFPPSPHNIVAKTRSKSWKHSCLKSEETSDFNASVKRGQWSPFSCWLLTKICSMMKCPLRHMQREERRRRETGFRRSSSSLIECYRIQKISFQLELSSY